MEGPLTGDEVHVTGRRIREDDPSLLAVAGEIGRQLNQRSESLVVAESVTGGWIGRVLTAVPGSSKWFYGAMVSYQVDAKERWLGVPADALAGEGAVSETVAWWMVRGALERSAADWAIATTGYAGAGADGEEAPERIVTASDPDPLTGLVYIGWGRQGQGTFGADIQCFRFSGSRESIRQHAVHAALAGLLERLHA